LVAIGVPRELVEGPADLLGGLSIAFVASALIEAHDDVARHDIVEAFEPDVFL
jgi:hypothetical protein